MYGRRGRIGLLVPTGNTVMEPEYEAYKRSPHQRVACVDCHIGSGASWAVKKDGGQFDQITGATISSESVVSILEKVFGKGPSEATAIMLAIHNTGLGVAGVYVLDVAETKVAAVHRIAEQRGYPLRSGVEKE